MKKSSQVAIGGLSSAIALLLMFMTGMVPLSSYFLPALAGMALIPVAGECGTKTGVLVYVVTSLLGLMVVPDREAVLLFILLLGYFPMLRPYIQRLPWILSWVLKLVLLNVVVFIFYLAIKYLFGIPDANEIVEIGIGLFLALINFTFLMYDYLLKSLFIMYKVWFRPKILRKLL